MWRVASVARSQNRRVSTAVGRCMVARWVDDTHQSTNVGRETSRNFSRKPPTILDDSEDLEELSLTKQQTKTFSADDMEFYGQFDDDGIDDDDDDDENALLDKEYKKRQEEIKRELDSRTGRPWTDPLKIPEELWMNPPNSVDDLPSWKPEFVSRVSQERVKVHTDGIPTLASLSKISLPPVACPHPGLGKAKAYAKYRKRSHLEYISGKVKEMAKPRVDKILAMSDWNDKQDAVDELFESIEDELREKESILGKHPQFGNWVEQSLQRYLASINEIEGGEKGNSDAETSTPIFMDCFNPNEPDEMVPTILSPLKPHPHDGPGRMVEEWEVAAHKKTKRIMIREPTRAIAQILEENDTSRIFVHGRRGIGKSAVLASVVASARRSGHIVLYLPDGDRLRKNGFYITPNVLRKEFFDLQLLSQEVCAQFLASHEKDLSAFKVSKETMERYFKDSQLERIKDYSGDGMGLVELLKYAGEKDIHAPMCFSAAIDTLMNQEDKPFLMVWDEFNCYYDRGHYYHMAYDESVKSPIPYEQINLFEHALRAAALSTNHDPDNIQEPKLMKRGGIVMGVTESHAVPRKVTDGLIQSAEQQSLSDATTRMHVVEVPRFSDVEADCILANFEATGVGKLRLDRGDTVMDKQEVAFLKMVSGNIGQHLLDASIM